VLAVIAEVGTAMEMVPTTINIATAKHNIFVVLTQIPPMI
jgi:hypothetical protein